MSARRLLSEVKRLTVRAGVDEAPVTLITIAIVDASSNSGPMEALEIVGHTLDYRIEGDNASFFFPFSQMGSAQAEELAQAIIAYTRKTERAGRCFQVGILDMGIARAGAIWLTALPIGRSSSDYAADIYRQVINSRISASGTNPATLEEQS